MAMIKTTPDKVISSVKFLSIDLISHISTPQNVTVLINQVYAFADRMYGEGKRPDPDLVLDEHALSRSRWVTREELQNMFLEKVKEHQYNEVIKVGSM